MSLSVELNEGSASALLLQRFSLFLKWPHKNLFLKNPIFNQQFQKFQNAAVKKH